MHDRGGVFAKISPRLCSPQDRAPQALDPRIEALVSGVMTHRPVEAQSCHTTIALSTRPTPRQAENQPALTIKVFSTGREDTFSCLRIHRTQIEARYLPAIGATPNISPHDLPDSLSLDLSNSGNQKRATQLSTSTYRTPITTGHRHGTASCSDFKAADARNGHLPTPLAVVPIRRPMSQHIEHVWSMVSRMTARMYDRLGAGQTEEEDLFKDWERGGIKHHVLAYEAAQKLD